MYTEKAKKPAVSLQAGNWRAKGFQQKALPKGYLVGRAIGHGQTMRVFAFTKKRPVAHF